MNFARLTRITRSVDFSSDWSNRLFPALQPRDPVRQSLTSREQKEI
jgi:hypothetical protein